MFALSVLLWLVAYVYACKRGCHFADEPSLKRVKYEMSSRFYEAYRRGSHEEVRRMLDSDKSHIVNESLFPFFAQYGDVEHFREMLAHPRLELNCKLGLDAFKTAVYANQLSIVKLILEDGRLDVEHFAKSIIRKHTERALVTRSMVALLLRYVSPHIDMLIALAGKIPKTTDQSKEENYSMAEVIALCLADTSAYPDFGSNDRNSLRLRSRMIEGDLNAIALLHLVDLCRTSSEKLLGMTAATICLPEMNFVLEASKRGKHIFIARHMQELAFTFASSKTLEDLKALILEMKEQRLYQLALCFKACMRAVLQLMLFRSHFISIGFFGDLAAELFHHLYFSFLNSN